MVEEIRLVEEDGKEKWRMKWFGLDRGVKKSRGRWERVVEENY